MNYIKPQLKITLFETENIEAAQASDPAAASFRGTISYSNLTSGSQQTVNLEKENWFAFKE